MEFITGDVETVVPTKAESRLAPGTVDFIFSRFLALAMSDWAAYIANVVMPLLKPGGWVELQDVDCFEFYSLHEPSRMVSRD